MWTQQVFLFFSLFSLPLRKRQTDAMCSGALMPHVKTSFKPFLLCGRKEKKKKKKKKKKKRPNARAASEEPAKDFATRPATQR